MFQHVTNSQGTKINMIWKFPFLKCSDKYSSAFRGLHYNHFPLYILTEMVLEQIARKRVQAKIIAKTWWLIWSLWISTEFELIWYVAVSSPCPSLALCHIMDNILGKKRPMTTALCLMYVRGKLTGFSYGSSLSTCVKWQFNHRWDLLSLEC